MMVHPDRFIVHNEYVSEEKKSELFRTASVVALPYIDATQSAVIATAYNYSKPVVATAVGGLPSMIDDGSTGFLIPPRDEKALADALIRLLTNDRLRETMGANAKKKAEDEYSADVAATRTLEVYRSLLPA
jgi:glycosyltransferase involved in cell wall biosynthesis